MRVAGWKISGARRFWGLSTLFYGWVSCKLTVIIRVFEGGEGSTSGGRSEKSRESGDLLLDDARERDGEGRLACMFAVAIMCMGVGVQCGEFL